MGVGGDCKQSFLRASATKVGVLFAAVLKSAYLLSTYIITLNFSQFLKAKKKKNFGNQEIFKLSMVCETFLCQSSGRTLRVRSKFKKAGLKSSTTSGI